jgi:uncharacterized damage-inducible protein DinB
MARYNAWQNSSLLAAAETLSDTARREDRGAFFGSIHGTLSHLLWGDLIWMSRFTGAEGPKVGIPDSTALFPDWTAYTRERAAADKRMEIWAAHLESDDLGGEMTWFSGAVGRDVSKPKALLIAHMFNHQTHHRGQVHAMLTAAGAKPGATDLFIMPDDI